MLAGRVEESLAEGYRAHELNPLSATILASLAQSYIAAQEYDKAIEVAKKAIELDPHCAQAYGEISGVYFVLGDYDKSRAYFLNSLRERGASAKELERAQNDRPARSAAESMRQFLKEQEARVARGKGGSRTSVSMGYALINDKEKALEWLERAYEAHDPHLVLINKGHDWDFLRSDPRFQAILRRMNFPQ